MSRIILPNLAPTPAATESTTPGQKLTGTGAGQPFEDYLDANQGNIGSQSHDDLPPGQAKLPVTATKKSAKRPAAAADASTSAPSMTIAQPASPLPANAIPSTKQSNPPKPFQQQAPTAPSPIIEAVAAQIIVKPTTPSVAATTAVTEAMPVPRLAANTVAKPLASSQAPPVAPKVTTPPTSAEAAAASSAAQSAKAQSTPTPPPVQSPATEPPPQGVDILSVSTSAPLVAAIVPPLTLEAAPHPEATLSISTSQAIPAPQTAIAPVIATIQTPAITTSSAAAPVGPPGDPNTLTQGVVAAASSAQIASGENLLELQGARTPAKAAGIAAPPRTSTLKQAGKSTPQAIPPLKVAPAEEETPDGTAIAKQNPAMSTAAQLPERETYFHPEAPAATDAAQAPQLPIPAAPKIIAAPQSRDSQQPPLPGANAPVFTISSSAIFTEKAAAPTASQTPASTALNHVMEAADKMTSDGSTQVEVQVNLGAGQQLTVRLQMTQGEVHPIFKTSSPELRQAIEENWSGFRTGATERGLQISNPVFESPGAGSGFNAFGDRGQSRQPGGEPSNADGAELSAKAAPSNVTSPTQLLPLPPAGSGSSVQMYA